MPQVVAWRSLEPPRTATAVIAQAAGAAGLASATARRVRGGAQLRAAASMDILLVLGSTDDLPWAPDIMYLGRDGQVLVPTVLTPDVPIDLLAQAARETFPAGTAASQLALLPGRAIAFDLSAGTVDPAWLDRWTGGTRQ